MFICTSLLSHLQWPSRIYPSIHSSTHLSIHSLSSHSPLNLRFSRLGDPSYKLFQQAPRTPIADTTSDCPVLPWQVGTETTLGNIMFLLSMHARYCTDPPNTQSPTKLPTQSPTQSPTPTPTQSPHNLIYIFTYTFTYTIPPPHTHTHLTPPPHIHTPPPPHAHTYTHLSQSQRRSRSRRGLCGVQVAATECRWGPRGGARGLGPAQVHLYEALGRHWGQLVSE